ncbi:MAG TPA: stage II sporulation protein M [Thermoanaerobaculia bacterium]|nr:stage II sporulation protein M [Thermoanaerobaculia bacterium]
MPAPAFNLKSTQFRREREEAWRELELLLERVETKGVRDLTPSELNRLPVLYRSAASSLSVATAISLDKNLLDYLTALVGRAYICVYGAKRRPAEAVIQFFRHDFPAVVRRYAGFVALSVALVALGVLAGYQLTKADPERYYSFVGEAMAQGRTPAASTQELRDVLYSGGKGMPLSIFASFLFTHNSKVGMLCFALGFMAGVPVVFLLLDTGLTLGAMAALYASRGLGAEFWAWILPHGVTEIGALCLCGAAGMVIGSSLVFPGRHTRLRNLALHGREVALLAMGAVVMFLVAGAIEGFFRQLVQDLGVRWSLAAVTLVFWTWYFLAVGRSHEHDRAR